MNEHTPVYMRDWYVSEGQATFGVYFDGTRICTVNNKWVRQKDVAALISAAPDLLAALEGVILVADRKTQEFDAARAAIAKAKS